MPGIYSNLEAAAAWTDRDPITPNVEAWFGPCRLVCHGVCGQVRAEFQSGSLTSDSESWSGVVKSDTRAWFVWQVDEGQKKRLRDVGGVVEDPALQGGGFQASADPCGQEKDSAGRFVHVQGAMYLKLRGSDDQVAPHEFVETFRCCPKQALRDIAPENVSRAATDNEFQAGSCGKNQGGEFSPRLSLRKIEARYQVR